MAAAFSTLVALVALTRPSSPGVGAAFLLAGTASMLPLSSVLFFLLPGPLLLCLLWVAYHKNHFPRAGLLRAVAAGVVALRVGLRLSHDSYLLTTVETAVAVAGIVWRVYVLATSLGATPPLVFATPLLALVVPQFAYQGDDFFRADRPLNEELVTKRKASFQELERTMGVAKAAGDDRYGTIRTYLADTRFTKTSSVFFPFQKHVSEHLDPTFVLDRVDNMRIYDENGEELWDAECSFGVNVIGYDAYKQFLTEGFKAAADRSVCLGKVTEHVQRNAERICRIAKKEQCSFHMSGTEAVMGAVRLARYNTGRPMIVTFAGAYHGWYDGVMQLGTTRPVQDLLVLKFGCAASIRALRARHREIAAVLVNPLCALAVNKPPPADFSLITNNRGTAPDPDREAYGAWLRELTELCRELGIVSIFDEVYVGFRYSRGGAQQFFGAEADVVCYGKTLGGGLPCGVICGSKRFLSRSNGSSPASKAIVIGTFSSHPCVMATMDQFLDWAEQPETAGRYETMNARVSEWAAGVNDAMDAAGFPVKVVTVGTIWGLRYTRPGRYHWMYQFFLRQAGLKLASIGTGRMNFSLSTSEEDFSLVQGKLLEGARQMREGGWWTDDVELTTSKSIMKALGKDIARAWVGRVVATVRRLGAAFGGSQRKEE